jgi:hypothetical protein
MACRYSHAPTFQDFVDCPLIALRLEIPLFAVACEPATYMGRQFEFVELSARGATVRHLALASGTAATPKKITRPRDRPTTPG